jgi:hypothetical protein
MSNERRPGWRATLDRDIVDTSKAVAGLLEQVQTAYQDRLELVQTQLTGRARELEGQAAGPGRPARKNGSPRWKPRSPRFVVN